MKHTTAFTNVWTKETLKRIKEEYRSSSYIFICESSDEFSRLWCDFNHEIRILAITFDESAKVPIDEGAIGSCLFYYHKGFSRDIRLAFLDHEINRLTP